MVGTRVDPVHLAVLSASFQLPKFSTLVLQVGSLKFTPVACTCAQHLCVLQILLIYSFNHLPPTLLHCFTT